MVATLRTLPTLCNTVPGHVTKVRFCVTVPRSLGQKSQSKKVEPLITNPLTSTNLLSVNVRNSPKQFS